MLRLTFEVEGERQLDVALGMWAGRVKDLTELWPSVLDRLISSTRENLDSEGGNVGGWPTLSPIYAAWKSLAYGTLPIMVREGRLRESLTDQGSSDMTVRTTKDSLTWGTDVSYAKYHQSPLPRRSNLPRRPLVALTRADQREIPRMMQAHIFREGGTQSWVGFA